MTDDPTEAANRVADQLNARGHHHKRPIYALSAGQPVRDVSSRGCGGRPDRVDGDRGHRPRQRHDGR